MKLMTLRLMLFALAYAPLQAIAEEVQVPTAPPAYYGSGPWHMWTSGGAWHFWLMFPMMIFFFLLLCALQPGDLQIGMGEQTQRDVPIPGVPAPHLIVI